MSTNEHLSNEHAAGICLHTMLHKVFRITDCLQGNVFNPEALQRGFMGKVCGELVPLLRETVRRTETKGQQDQTCQI